MADSFTLPLNPKPFTREDLDKAIAHMREAGFFIGEAQETQEILARVRAQLELAMKTGKPLPWPMIPFVNTGSQDVQIQIGETLKIIGPNQEVDIPEPYTRWR